MILIVAKLHKLDSKSINFLFAFLQVDLDVPVYMELPVGATPLDVEDTY